MFLSDFNGAAVYAFAGRICLTLYFNGRSCPATVAVFSDPRGAAEGLRALAEGSGSGALGAFSGPRADSLARACADRGVCLATFDGRARGRSRLAFARVPLADLPPAGRRFVEAFKELRRIGDTARACCRV